MVPEDAMGGLATTWEASWGADGHSRNWPGMHLSGIVIESAPWEFIGHFLHFVIDSRDTSDISGDWHVQSNT